MVRRRISIERITSQSRLEGEYPSWDVQESFLWEAFLRTGDETPHGSSEDKDREDYFAVSTARGVSLLDRTI